MNIQMTIEQTVEIPVDHRLMIEVPQEIPAGKAMLAFTPLNVQPELKSSRKKIDDLTRELRELCKGSTLTVERFLEMQREDCELEEAKYLRLFHKSRDKQ
jgi:hypothetical protein